MNMQVKLNVGKVSESSTLKTIETVTNLKISKNELNQYFSFLKESSLLKASSFDDSIWSMPDENKDRDIIFKFDIEVYKELNEALKGYILLKRMTGTTIGSCHSILNTLKKAIFETKGLEDLSSLESVLIKKTQIVSYETASIIKQFLLFYEHPLNNGIIVVCNQIKKPERQNRNLPHFGDVITFNNHIERFFAQTHKQDVNYIRFYPI